VVRILIVVLFLILINAIIWGYKDKVKGKVLSPDVKFKEYIVQPYDTELWGIVVRECEGDIRYNIYLIRERNNINPNEVYIGQKLYIPAGEGF
jgi:hypothetical protein